MKCIAAILVLSVDVDVGSLQKLHCAHVPIESCDPESVDTEPVTLVQV